MPDTALSTTSLILGRSLITAETIYQDVRERLAKSLAKMSHRASFQEALGMARKILAEAEPDFADHLSQSDLAAWLAGFHWTSQQFPFWLNREFSLVNEGPPKPPTGKLLWPWEEDQPIVRFPLLERAAESLEQRGILSKQEFDQAATDIKLRSFTMAGDNTAAVLEEIRDAIAKDVQEGTSLRGFQEKFAEIVNASSLGPWHVETVYRTNVQSSFRDGRETLINDPIVNRVFPYQEYFAIRDARAREDHLALEKLGLDGTGIYRRDDRIWDYFTPPWDYNCFLPGTIVQGRFNLGLKSWYAGQAFEIVTSSGNRLSVTANHPILTPQGFVAVKSLRQRDNILCYRDDIKRQGRKVQSMSVVMSRSPKCGNKQYAPSTIEEVFSALENFGRIGSFPLTTDNLHGDAQPWNGNVNVVGAVGDLPRDLKSIRSDCLTDVILADSNMQLPGFAGHGFSPLGSIRSCSAKISPSHSLDVSNCSLGIRGALQFLNVGEASNLDASLYEPFPYGRVTTPQFFRKIKQRFSGLVATSQDCNVGQGNSLRMPLELLDLRSTPQLDTCTSKATAQSAFADVRLAGELCNRFSGSVSIDEIVEIREFQYSGHVYDLQSPFGFMVANSIVASNCRCGVSPLTISDAAAKGVREAREWLESGSPPTTPEWRYQFIPFEPKPGFGQRGRVVRAAA